MTKQEFIRMCELSMIAAMPEYTVTKPGRLRNRLETLRNMAMDRIEYMPRPDNQCLQEIYSVIAGFDCDLGWLNRQRHPLTVANFCSFIAEDMGEERITDFLITEIIGFLDTDKRKPQSRASLAAGKLAYEKWQKLKSTL